MHKFKSPVGFDFRKCKFELESKDDGVSFTVEGTQAQLMACFLSFVHVHRGVMLPVVSVCVSEVHKAYANQKPEIGTCFKLFGDKRSKVGMRAHVEGEVAELCLLLMYCMRRHERFCEFVSDCLKLYPTVKRHLPDTMLPVSSIDNLN